MYVYLNDLFSVFPGVASLLWLISGYRAGRLTYRPTEQKLRKGARTTLIMVGVSSLFSIIILVAMALTIQYGWDIAEAKIITMTPQLVVPLVFVFAVSVPALVGLARHKADDPEAAPSPVLRASVARPWLVVPIQATAVGGLAATYYDLLRRPTDLTGAGVLEFWLPIVVLTALLVLRQRRLTGIRRRPGAITPAVNRRLARLGIVAVVVAGVAGGSAAIWSSASVLPGDFSMMNMDNVDYGGGPAYMAAPGSPGSIDVTSLTGPVGGKPDDTFVLTATKKLVRLSSGKIEEGAAFNNQIPGPQLTVHQGDLVQVTLINKLPSDGLTLHWHGVNVPNAEDGVAGVTQDSVKPGQSYTYRFRVEQTGSYWYHTHNDPASLVRAGLFGAFIVLPKTTSNLTSTAVPAPKSVDITEMAHTWQGGDDPAFGTSDTLQRHVIAPGTQVRLRLINTDNNPVGGAGRAQARNFGLAGTSYQVVAIDGNNVNKPTEISGDRLLVAAGGRYDVTFTMPDTAVRLTDISVPDGGELFSPTGAGTVAPIGAKAPVFDPASYGAPAPVALTVNSKFNRRFNLVLDDHLGFYNGVWAQMPTINGESFPNIPMLVVHEGDLVEETIVNRSHNNHPMHLHGHTALVLSVNGKPTTGSPWYTDTLDVEPGQTYEIGFVANNPGVWMDHCHNLDHSAGGMMTMLMYDNVTSPFMVGPQSGNTPD